MLPIRISLNPSGLQAVTFIKIPPTCCHCQSFSRSAHLQTKGQANMTLTKPSPIPCYFRML